MFKFFIHFLSIILFTHPTFSLHPKGERGEFIYQCLELEKQAGFKVNPNSYILLDNILLQAEKRIGTKNLHTTKNPTSIMLEVHKVLEELGITGDYTQKDPYKNLLSYSLEKKKFDCDKYTFIFLAIAEKMNLPLYAVLLPRHMCIEWKDDKNHFFWETTDKNVFTKEYYINRFHLNNFHFQEKMYLTKFSKEDLRLCFLYNIGLTQLMSGRYKEAQNYLEASKTLKGINPYVHEMIEVCQYYIQIKESTGKLSENLLNENARINRAKAHIQLKGKDNYKSALEDLNFILTINPENQEAHLWLGIIYLQNFIQGSTQKIDWKYNKAIKEFNIAILLNPKYQDAFLYRGILERWAGLYEPAEKDIETALSINRTEKALIEKGNILFKKNKFNDAIQYYNEAIKTNPKSIEAIEYRGFANFEIKKKEEASEDLFKAYYYGLLPLEVFQKYLLK